MPLHSHERERLQKILFHPWTLASVLYAIVIRLYGEEDVHHWEPETLVLELKDDFGEEIPSVNQAKLHALIAAVTSPGFYSDWTTFMAICHTLSHGEDPLDMSDPIMVAEMCWGVTEVRLVDDTPGKFGDEVSRFVGRVLDYEGFTKPPPQLQFAHLPTKELVDSPGDEGKAETLSTEHAQVAAEYVREQSLLLIQQISALPWHTHQSLEELTVKLQEMARN